VQADVLLCDPKEVRHLRLSCPNSVTVEVDGEGNFLAFGPKASERVEARDALDEADGGRRSGLQLLDKRFLGRFLNCHNHLRLS
jgi:hypothetical protein